MALGLQYFFETKSHFGKILRTEIWRQDYEGTPIRIIFGSANPLKIQYPSNNSDDIFYPIWGGSLNIQFYEQQDLSLENIITDYERQVRFDQYVNGELYYRGWVVPDLCHDSAYRTNYVLSLTATDAIGDLSNFPLLVSEDDKAIINDKAEFGYNTLAINNTVTTEEGFTYAFEYGYENGVYGLIYKKIPIFKVIGTKVSILSLIKTCLDKAELDFGYKVINDIYETSLQTQDERVLEKVFTDYLCYASDNKSKNCEEVLMSIFRSLGLVVVQRSGVWNILRIPYLLSDTVLSEYYDKDIKFLATKKENIRRILRPTDSETPKHWHFLIDEFIREPRRPYQYQNIEYAYGESLNVGNNWTAKNIVVTNGVSQNGSESYMFTDNQVWDLDKDVSIINNNSSINEAKKRELKNTYFYKYIETGLFSNLIEVPNKTDITISFSSTAKKGIAIIYADVELDGGKIKKRYYYVPSQKVWYAQDQIDSPTATVDLIATQLIFETQGNNNTSQELNYSIPINVNIAYDAFPEKIKLTIILRGGTLTNDNVPDNILYTNLKINSTQVKEVHSYTNLNKVSNKPDTLTSLNGDGFNGGSTISSYLIEKQTTDNSNVFKKIATNQWKDSSNQIPNNLLSFTAQRIVSNYYSHRNIVRGSMRTKRNIKLGDVLSFSGYSKFAYKRFVVMPPFDYDLREDIYKLTLFEISCDIAKGRLKEYYIDSNDVPLAKYIADFEGHVCEPSAFELEIECQDEVFTIETVC